MLGRRISIWRIETAWAFYGYIAQSPSKGRLVKHLDIGKLDIGTHELNKRLLRLIFTPNLEILRGQNCQSDYYDEMTRIAKESPTTFRKLNVIPHPLSFTKSYRDSAMLFKDTLQDAFVLDLDMLHTGDNDVKYLKQFKRLTSFAFYFSSIVCLKYIDVLLDTLPQVKKIKLHITAEADDWAMQRGIEFLEHIPKNHVLKRLKITTTSAAIMCVLMSKFVSLESLELDLEVENDELEIPYAVMLVAKPVPCFNYSFIVLKDGLMRKKEIEDFIWQIRIHHQCIKTGDEYVLW
ncbi:Maintenance of ploidy protein mob2 [Mucor velutinosus]|uniref:Maintenance of ploidy protein mob2 n=1 Tax=Mucor velutinosus TaxID=708070 RepID=A0AAN7DCA7_9FUNG|nr:Maintenance of ploidy protein mob2 [Mucor velutinosus]